MTNGQSSVGSDGGELISPLAPELHRERVSVRRRRARSAGSDRRQKSPSWVAARSRRRMARSFALCAGVLLLMAIGLYFGLAHQDNAAPVEGAAPFGAVGIA
jgi:hypothetical protein